eukprot:365408-Chlamydomonas_euryale.AAC.24
MYVWAAALEPFTRSKAGIWYDQVQECGMFKPRRCEARTSLACASPVADGDNHGAMLGALSRHRLSTTSASPLGRPRDDAAAPAVRARRASPPHSDGELCRARLVATAASAAETDTEPTSASASKKVGKYVGRD